MNRNSDSDSKKHNEIIYESWLLQNRRLSCLINKLSTEDINKDIVCGRNCVAYLIGHLIASNDQLNVIFDFGKLVFPEYKDLFLKTPDKCGQKYPDIDKLKSNWFLLNELLKTNFEKFEPNDWLIRQEKLRAMLQIINHQSYHHGQLSFIY